MDGLWDFFSRQLASNQFFSGGLILMLSGAALAAAAAHSRANLGLGSRTAA